MDRKAELERKKAKLQALRDDKDRRRREKEQQDLENAKAGAAAPEKDTRKYEVLREIEEIDVDTNLTPF